jgi:outer membrane protein TolC
MPTARAATGAPGEKPGMMEAGGRHRPWWKLTDDPMLQHAIKTQRRDRRAKVRRFATKGIAGGHTTEKLPYPSGYHQRRALEAQQRPGISGSAKRRRRKGGNPKGGPGQGGVQGATRRLAEAVKGK